MVQCSLLDLYDPAFAGGYSAWAGAPYRTAQEVAAYLDKIIAKVYDDEFKGDYAR